MQAMKDIEHQHQITILERSITYGSTEERLKGIKLAFKGLPASGGWKQRGTTISLALGDSSQQMKYPPPDTLSCCVGPR